MANPQITKHMDVVSSTNDHLGRVDHVEGDRLKLARDALGQHHLIPLRWVARIDDKVHLSHSTKDVERLWAGEDFQ